MSKRARSPVPEREEEDVDNTLALPDDMLVEIFMQTPLVPTTVHAVYATSRRWSRLFLAAMRRRFGAYEAHKETMRTHDWTMPLPHGAAGVIPWMSGRPVPTYLWCLAHNLHRGRVITRDVFPLDAVNGWRSMWNLAIQTTTSVTYALLWYWVAHSDDLTARLLPIRTRLMDMWFADDALECATFMAMWYASANYGNKFEAGKLCRWIVTQRLSVKIRHATPYDWQGEYLSTGDRLLQFWDPPPIPLFSSLQDYITRLRDMRREEMRYRYSGREVHGLLLDLCHHFNVPVDVT